MSWRSSVVLLVTMLGCNQVEEVTAPAVLAVPPVDATRANVFSSSTAPAMPASYLEFDKEVDTKCPFDETDSSTGGMVSAEMEVLECISTLIENEKDSVYGPVRAALLDGTPGGPHIDPTAPRRSLWGSVIDARCRIEGAQIWVQGGTYMAGTMEENRAVGCFHGPDQALAFILRSWNNKKAGDVVALVRAEAKNRPEPTRRLELWRRYAALARRAAPHRAVGWCRVLCRWSDAEWMNLERDIEMVSTTSVVLAKAFCDAWPELTAGFGGAKRCTEEMASYWLPSGEWSEEPSDPAPDAKAEPVDVNSAPPADDLYDAATSGLRRTWANNNQAVAGAAKYLDDAAALLRVAPYRAWIDRVDSLRDRFVMVDEQAQFAGVSESTEGYTKPAPRLAGPTARLLEGYFLRLLADGKLTELATHMKGREKWGGQVEKNLSALGARYRAKCKAEGMRSCEGSAAKGRKEVASRIDALLKESAELGKDLCREVPDLPRALGDKGCAQRVARHLLSFAEYTGKGDLLEP